MPKKLFLLVIAFFSYFSIWLASNNNVVYGADPCKPKIDYQVPAFIPEQTKSFDIKFSNQSDGWYRLRFYENGLQVYTDLPYVESKNGSLTITIDDAYHKLDRGKHTITLLRADDSGGKNKQDYCGFVDYSVGYDYSTCKMFFTPPGPTDQDQIGIRVEDAPSGSYIIQAKNSGGAYISSNFGYISVGSNGVGTAVAPSLGRPDTLTISLLYEDINPIGLLNKGKQFCQSKLEIIPSSGKSLVPLCSIIPPVNTGEPVKIQAFNLPKNAQFRADLDSQNVSGNVGSTNDGQVNIDLGKNILQGQHTGILWDSSNSQVCAVGFTVNPDGKITSSPPAGSAKKCGDSGAPECSKAGGESCTDGLTDKQKADGVTGIKTAIGCVPTEPKALVEGILKVTAAGIGAIALLLMVLGAFKMITSDGNPETIQGGKDQFTAAFLGLLFIIFSVLLLQVIGVDILGIPGFGK